MMLAVTSLYAAQILGLKHNSRSLITSFPFSSSPKSLPGGKWSPKQCAKFVLEYDGPFDETGALLRPLVDHWRGLEIGHFLTYLYLANEARPKEASLAAFLQGALPDEAFEKASILIGGHVFLGTRHTYKTGPVYVSFTFNRPEFSSVIGGAFGSARKQVLGEWTGDAVVDLLLDDSLHNDHENTAQVDGYSSSRPWYYDPKDPGRFRRYAPITVLDFLVALGIRLPFNECVGVAEKLCRNEDLSPEFIENFASNIIEPIRLPLKENLHLVEQLGRNEHLSPIFLADFASCAIEPIHLSLDECLRVIEKLGRNEDISSTFIEKFVSNTIEPIPRLPIKECLHVVEELARNDLSPTFIAKFVSKAIEPIQEDSDDVPPVVAETNPVRGTCDSVSHEAMTKDSE